MYLDKALNFNLHIKEKMSKAIKSIGIIQKLSKTRPRNSLITIYKSFVRLNLDYGDIIYDQPNNESFTQKIERIQYNAALEITDVTKETSQDKLYNELGFESLKFKTSGLPEHLFGLIIVIRNGKIVWKRGSYC